MAGHYLAAGISVLVSTYCACHLFLLDIYIHNGFTSVDGSPTRKRRNLQQKKNTYAESSDWLPSSSSLSVCSTYPRCTS
jgi:hypothetical protein